MRINHRSIFAFVLGSFGVLAIAQTTPYDMPNRIKNGTGASAYYLEKSTAGSSWQNCTSTAPGMQDSTCVVPYQYAAAAGLATITASLTKANPIIGGTGTSLKWTTTNAVSVTVVCAGVANYGPAMVPAQGNPSGIILTSALAGPVTCTWVAKNSDDEPVTATATAIFAPPVPPTIAAGFTSTNPVIGGGGTAPVWNSTGAKNVHVDCVNAPPPGYTGYVPLQGNPSGSNFNWTTPKTITCNYTATNDVGQTATATASATFQMPPPPSVNAWWEPATIKAGESSMFHYASANVTYLGIVCSGVGYSFADSGGAKNTSWYYNPMYFSTAGQQDCGVQGVNAAGQVAVVEAPLYINAAGTPAGSMVSSPPPYTGMENCDPLNNKWNWDCRGTDSSDGSGPAGSPGDAPE